MISLEDVQRETRQRPKKETTARREKEPVPEEALSMSRPLGRERRNSLRKIVIIAVEIATQQRGSQVETKGL